MSAPLRKIGDDASFHTSEAEPTSSVTRAGDGHQGVDVSTTEEELALCRAVIQGLPFGLSVQDEAGRHVLSNPAALRMLGIETVGLGGGSTAMAPARIFETMRSEVFSCGSSYALSTIVDVTKQRKIEEALFERAYLDELTGLPNRDLMRQTAEELIAERRDDHVFALAFIDLDNFKHINDYYGHAVGDALLIKIGARLGGLSRQSDMLARIGGDEFLFLLNPVGDDLSSRLDELMKSLKKPFFIDGHEIFASASIGVSLFPQHGATFDVLRRNADNAMYRVKDGVKGQVAVFDSSIERVVNARMKLEQRLRLAIRDKRFCCAYQPKVDIRTRKVKGLEVLLRWRDEQGIIQAPGDFVAIAVELGLINQIAHVVLDETMAALPVIDDMFGPDVTISINVAAKQAEDGGFMAAFVRKLAATGCAHRLMIELTEEAFFSKSRFQSEFLPQLRAIGTKVSIDDFGVGYSSLSALADITADEIKIDRSFIMDVHKRPRSQSILKAILSLAEALNMSIVAEGVETIEELGYLEAFTTISLAQGFFFARPMVIESADPLAFMTHERSGSIARETRVARGGASR